MSSRKRKNNRLFFLLGLVLIIFSVAIIIFTYFPVVKSEIAYQLTPQNLSQLQILPTPVSTEFSLIIPKIGVNTPVIKDVDPQNSSQYQSALSRGLAHARGSSFPGLGSNVFIFAHSANSWYQANRYNAVFYLIDKLGVGDTVISYYQNHPYYYSVTEKKIVNSQSVEYISPPTSASTLTLMTCWPPGTTLRRLLIIAKPLIK